jgi:hypothetical protein
MLQIKKQTLLQRQKKPFSLQRLLRQGRKNLYPANAPSSHNLWPPSSSVKLSEKFPSVFHWHLISIDIPPQKENGYCVYL